MSLFGLLSIARDGVTAQAAALSTTGQNVANVGTPGYVRRTAVLQTALTGGGVQYARTERSFDRFTFGHAVSQQGKFGAASARSQALAGIETTMAPPNGSIGERATSLVRAFNALSGFPIDPSLRADFVAKATNLSQTVSDTSSQLESTAESLLGRTLDTVGEVNQRLKRVADLNLQIATAVGTGADAGALRDQRDTAIREVGERIGARAIEDASGRMTVFAAGSVLVEGDNVSPLSMDLDANGAMRFYVSGAARSEVTARIDAGTIGGLREARDVDLAKTRADLDSYAFDVANTFNAVHTTGYGLDGATGRPLFTVPTAQAGAAKAMSVDASLVGHPERVAASASATDLPGGNTIALALARLGEQPAFGGATLTDRFVTLATDVGFRKSSADNELNLRTDTLAVANSLADSANGVSIDEEMIDLSKYQRAFEASTRVLRAADELLRSLMESF